MKCPPSLSSHQRRRRPPFLSVTLPRLGLVVTAVLFASAPASQAALSDGQRCLVAKHKAVGKHAVCVLKQYGAAAASMSAPDTGACDTALATAIAKADATWGAQCRTSNDAAVLESRDAALTSAIDAIVDANGAGGGDALACSLARVKAAARRAQCGAKAETQLIAKHLVARDLSTCDAKLTADYAKADTIGNCSAGVTADALRGAVDAAFREVEADLANLHTADYAARGRYRSSKRTVTFVDSSRPTRPNGSYAGAPDRTLVTTIWYPSVSTLPGGAFADVPGPVPLVIRAHGFSGYRDDSEDLAKHLASRGMIVVSPDFPLSNLNAPGGPTLGDLDEQIVDVGFLIDSMLAESATPGSPFAGKVDGSRIGVIGHSLGGATVLGAGYHPTLHDARIDAVVALAPLACMYEESFYDGGGTAPLMILSGSGDLVTPPASNHVAAFARANPEKYLVTLDGGLHIGFADDFLHDDSINADDAVACPALLPPGSPRPVTLTFSFPPDFLGGEAAGVDLSGSTCEPLCPLPGPTWMAHNRQRDIELAASAAMFDRVFAGSVSADRMITGLLDTDNDDVTLAYER